MQHPLLDKPLFFDNSNCVKCRNFNSYSEINKIEMVLEQIIEIDKMLAFFDLDIAKYKSKYFLNVTNLLLTTWVLCRTTANVEVVSFHPILPSKFKLFYMELWEEGKYGRKIRDAKKNDFLLWIANKIGVEVGNLSKNLISFFDIIFKKVGDELFHIKVEDLNANYLAEFFIIDG